GYTIEVTTDCEEGVSRRSVIAYVRGGTEFKTLNRLPLERTLYAFCRPETIGYCEHPSLHPVTQDLEQLTIRVAVRRPAQGYLRAPDGLPGIGTYDAVGRAGFETLLLQALLQLHPFGAGQRIIVDRPAGQHLTAPLESLGQQADGQGVAGGIVVFQDAAEVVQDRKSVV